MPITITSKANTDINTSKTRDNAGVVSAFGSGAGDSSRMDSKSDREPKTGKDLAVAIQELKTAPKHINNKDEI